MRQDTLEIFPFHFQKLFGGLSMACDFADLVQSGDYSVTAFPAQNGFCTRPVALLQGAFGPVRARRPLCLGEISIRQTASQTFY